MTHRSEYFFHLPGFSAPDPQPEAVLQMRAVQPADVPALAELMLDAYQGTIDYDGETYADALAEVSAFFGGERGGPAWLELSFVAMIGVQVVGACLVSEWSERQLPIIAYVLTGGGWKKRGIGRQLLTRALQICVEEADPEARAVITDGNTPSVRLFPRSGFQRVTR